MKMIKNLNEKICIVGSGPSGMSAAWYLQKKGYTDITILERLDRVGGKCNTPKFDGKYYEMGAVIALPTYYKSLALMDEAGIGYIHKKIKPTISFNKKAPTILSLILLVL